MDNRKFGAIDGFILGGLIIIFMALSVMFDSQKKQFQDVFQKLDNIDIRQKQNSKQQKLEIARVRDDFQIQASLDGKLWITLKFEETHYWDEGVQEWLKDSAWMRRDEYKHIRVVYKDSTIVSLK